MTETERDDALVRDLALAFAAGRYEGGQTLFEMYANIALKFMETRGLAPTTKVRPLVWEETFTDRGDGSQDQTGWEADSGFGSWYDISQYFASDSYGWQVQYNCEVIADRDDPDQAKADAQAHFEKSVLAALTDSSTDREGK